MNVLLFALLHTRSTRAATKKSAQHLGSADNRT